jgi:hypothetical protein
MTAESRSLAGESVPPSKVAKTSLQFEKSDGSHFTLQVNSDATVAQLKREIAIEEKVDVRSLRFVFSLEDPDDAETLLVSEARDMLEHAAISQYPLADATIFIWGPPPPITPPTSFYVCVILDDERKLQVEVTFQLTLNDFREAVRLQHNVPITDDVLILVGKELIGDEIPIWDLGFVPDCVVHAGKLKYVYRTTTLTQVHTQCRTFPSMLRLSGNKCSTLCFFIPSRGYQRSAED